MVAFEVAAEVGGEGVAKLGGDYFDGQAGGEESCGLGHADAMEVVARGAVVVLLAEALELAAGEVEAAGGTGDVPLGVLHEGLPELLARWGGGVLEVRGHRLLMSLSPLPIIPGRFLHCPGMEATGVRIVESGSAANTDDT